MIPVGAFVRAGIAAGVSFCRAFTVETRDVDLPVAGEPPRTADHLGPLQRDAVWQLSGGDKIRIHALSGSAIYGWHEGRWCWSSDVGSSWHPTAACAKDGTLSAAPGEHWVEVIGFPPSRAVGLQHAQTPGEVSGGPSPDPSPSPGAFPLDLSEELLRGYVIAYAALAGVDLAEAADSLRRVANLIGPRVQVREDELSAHITAIRNAWSERWQRGETNDLTLSDEIARDLVSDYGITKK